MDADAGGAELDAHRAGQLGVRLLRRAVERGQRRAAAGADEDDVGAASAYGLGYLHVHESGTARRGIGYMTYFGYGIEGRLATDDHSRVDAGIVSAAGRAGTWGHGGGLSVELLAGAGIGDGRAIPVGSLGAFWGLYFFELGYSFQLPLAAERPAWCSSHQFSVRLHIPLHSYARRQWTEPAPPR